MRGRGERKGDLFTIIFKDFDVYSACLRYVTGSPPTAFEQDMSDFVSSETSLRKRCWIWMIFSICPSRVNVV